MPVSIATDIGYTINSIEDDVDVFPPAYEVTVISTTGLVYASTTFIPTLIYLTILATLIISKAILGAGVRVTKFLLETATEIKDSKDLAVFTLTGSLFSVIALLLTAFTKLWQILH